MKTKTRFNILRIISLTVILSLLVSSCVMPSLAGAANTDATEVPAVEAPPTEAPVVEAPQTEAPVVEAPATETPVVVEAAPTETPTVEAAAAVSVPTDTPTPTATSTAAANSAAGASVSTSTNITTPTPTPTSTSTSTTTPTKTAIPTAGNGRNASAAGVIVSTSTSTPTSTATSAPTATPQNTSTPTNTPIAQPDPYLGLGVSCNNNLTATFKITNIGGPMTGGTYTITEPGKAPQTATFDLDTNKSISFTIAGNANINVQYATSLLDQVNLSATGTCLPLPTSTPTQTQTPSKTPTVTNTAGPSPTPTNTKTATPTKTLVPTSTPTATNTPGPSPTPTNTSTATLTKTPTPSKTPSPTNTAGPSPTPTNTNTATATNTPKPTKTFTPTQTPSPTNTAGPSPTPTFTKTTVPTNTPTFTPTTTSTPSPTPTIEILDGQLDLNVFCNPDLSATFVISNISGSVSNGAYNLSDPAKSGTINLPSGGNTSINGAGYATMTVTYRTTFLSSVTLSVVGSCSKRPINTPTNTPTITPTFTATNTPANTPTKTATSTLTSTPTNTPTSTPTSTPTNTPVPPKLTAVGVCTADTAQATFTITNSGGDMPVAYTYNVKDSTGSVVKTNTFQLKAGSTVTITTSGNFGVLTLSITDDKGTTTDAATTTCVKLPKLTATGVCTKDTTDATFVITNNGGDMPVAYTYNIKDNTGKVVKTDTFQLKAGGSTTITTSGTYGVLTLSITDDKGTTTDAATTTCVKLPKLTATGVCTTDTAEATFVITNSGSDMPIAYTYNIKDSTGKVVKTDAFKLTAGASVTITTASGMSGVLTLSITDDKGTTTDAATTTCVKAPKLTATGVCTTDTAEATFVITNSGSDMPIAYTYNVKDSAGKVVKTDTFQLTAGGSVTITTTSGMSGVLTLSITDDKGTTTDAATTTCVKAPKLTAIGTCMSNTKQATFAITNNGNDMLTAYTYNIKDNTGKVVKTDTFQLKAGGSLSIAIDSKAGATLTLFITDDKKTTTQAAITTCVESTKDAKSIPALAPAKSEPCIQCLIFHTFRDENLEIYRLDGIEGQPGFKLYNLSKNEAVDSRPSRAPNDSLIVFQSNRDGNVELYTTDLLGSSQAARLTKTHSNNTTPMFGPDARTIVYQSDRNGNMDLFTIDKNTGKERQITSDPANDINPFYSPDLEWLVFQSNRNNNWDLFVLNTKTGNEYQLTDTPKINETFPAWSPNGKQISFISEEDGKTDLYIIDSNGEHLKPITADGKTVNNVWSPEGFRIAYQSERNGNLDVYSYDLRDDKEYRVTDDKGPDSGPTWDCGGTNLAFTSIRDGDANVFQAFWKGSPAGNMTIDPATDKWSQWRPSNDVSSTGY